MTTHTDRIRQMAQEAHAAYLKAGRALPRDFSDDTHRVMWEAATAAVAQLVAKDCASIADLYGMPDGSSQAAINISNAIKARFGIEDQV